MWTLVFDTETTTDASQAFRFGAYQIRNGSELDESGIMYEPTALTAEERDLLATYARSNDLKLMTREVFVERDFYGRAYEHRATIIGFRKLRIRPRSPFGRLAYRSSKWRGENGF